MARMPQVTAATSSAFSNPKGSLKIVSPAVISPCGTKHEKSR